jgi:hypothetical protein
MSAFNDLLNEYLGQGDALTDIRVIVRRLYFYDFRDDPIRLWQGQGKLFTNDGKEWLGSISGAGVDIHKTPSIQDGRDGSSASYTFSLQIPDLPGQNAMSLYEELKADQNKVSGRTITCYLAIFKEGEALRPVTPIRFFKQLVMRAPKFSEKITQDGNGTLVRSYTVKDGNAGRSNVPNRSYSDAHQKEHARQLGQNVDRGCEFLGLLANRTYQVP